MSKGSETFERLKPSGARSKTKQAPDGKSAVMKKTMTEHEALAYAEKILKTDKQKRKCRARAKLRRVLDAASFCFFALLALGIFNLVVTGPVIHYWICGQSNFSGMLWWGLAIGPIILDMVLVVLGSMVEFDV